jgi:transposase
VPSRCHVSRGDLFDNYLDCHSPNRLFVDAVLWILRTGAPWRDLPPAFGHWNSVFVRFNRWSQKGVWDRVFKALAEDPDFEHVMIDATIVRDAGRRVSRC